MGQWLRVIPGRWFPSGRKGWADLAIGHVSHRRTLLQGLHEVEWPRIADAPLSPLRNHAKWTAFSKAAAPSFFSSIHARYNNVTRILLFSLLPLFLLFFEKHIYNGRCVFYFFFPPREPIQRDISVKIFATIFTSFHPPDTVSRKDRWLCIYVYSKFLLLYPKRDKRYSKKSRILNFCYRRGKFSFDSLFRN